MSGKPKTLDECFSYIEKKLSKEDITSFKNMDENSLAILHHTLGRQIRNDLGLWAGSDLKSYLEGIGLTHPDDMSSVIITSFHRHLNKKALRLKDQVQFFKRYWEEVNLEGG